MKFSINQSELQNALSVVLKGIATRSTLPILSGIYLDAHDDTLTLQATDLELSIQYSVSALIEETGKAVVPGKLFSEIVKNLPDAAVHVAAEDDSAVITCDTASFSIKTLDAEDFPGFPHVDVQQEVSIPFTQFASMVKRVARVVSKDESRAILTGVLITLEDTTLKMVATDSYRLAITEAELPESSAEEFQAVIAGSFLQEEYLRCRARRTTSSWRWLRTRSSSRTTTPYSSTAAWKATSRTTASCCPIPTPRA